VAQRSSLACAGNFFFVFVNRQVVEVVQVMEVVMKQAKLLLN
jgi:hypothetical protein